MLVPYIDGGLGIMRHPNYSYYEKSKYSIPHSDEKLLPEEVILDLHEIFLTSGLHVLEVATFEYGRNLVIDIHNAIKYYQHIGYLSDSSIAMYEKALFYNIHALLKQNGYIDKQNDSFEQFFTDIFFFDFIVIECSDYLNKMPWKETFINQVCQFTFDTQLPIIMIQKQK